MKAILMFIKNFNYNLKNKIIILQSLNAKLILIQLSFIILNNLQNIYL